MSTRPQPETAVQTPRRRSGTPQGLGVGARRIVAGMSNRDIASDMAISAKTVQFHIGNIYSKFGVRNRLQLANRIRERGQD